MPLYSNLVVDESDGYARYHLVDRTGSIVAADVRLVLSSNVLQQGNQWGAREANTLLSLDENGAPVLALDGGTY